MRVCGLSYWFSFVRFYAGFLFYTRNMTAART